MSTIDLTILMPCLNEEKSIGACIQEAQAYIDSHGYVAEVLVVDNGSTDASASIAASLGARVVKENRKGYGRALRTGFEKAKGNIIVFADCDTTYDFLHLDPIYMPLAENKVDFMIGDRFAGQMEKGAMSLSHRLGVPFLSWCGRVRFGVKIHDWHCGVRGIRRDALARLDLKTDGMEFATEMIAEAARKGLRIGEVSVPLRVSRFERKQKLRTIRDGFRHLWYIVKA